MTRLLRRRAASHRPQGFSGGPGARMVQPFRCLGRLGRLELSRVSSLAPPAPTVLQHVLTWFATSLAYP